MSLLSISATLRTAAYRGYTDVVKWLLENGANVNATSNSLTILHSTDHADVIKLILTRNPDLSIRSSSRETPLQRAAAKFAWANNAADRRKWEEIVQLYLDAKAEYDLQTAIYLDDLKQVKTILSRSPDLAHVFQGDSPLRIAASLGRLGICEYLVESRRVDVNEFRLRSEGWDSPILAHALAHPDVVRLLIRNGADVKSSILVQSFSPYSGDPIIGDRAQLLHWAARAGDPESINLLIDNGIDIFTTTRDSLYENLENTALEIAAYYGKAGNVNAILNHPSFTRANQQFRDRLLNKAFFLDSLLTRPRFLGTLTA